MMPSSDRKRKRKKKCADDLTKFNTDTFIKLSSSNFLSYFVIIRKEHLSTTSPVGDEFSDLLTVIKTLLVSSVCKYC